MRYQKDEIFIGSKGIVADMSEDGTFVLDMGGALLMVLSKNYKYKQLKDLNMKTAKEVVKAIEKQPELTTELLQLWMIDTLAEVNQILLEDVRGYEGCATAMEKINKMRCIV